MKKIEKNFKMGMDNSTFLCYNTCRKILYKENYFGKNSSY